MTTRKTHEVYATIILTLVAGSALSIKIAGDSAQVKVTAAMHDEVQLAGMMNSGEVELLPPPVFKGGR